MKKKAKRRPAQKANEKIPHLQAALICEKVLHEETVPTLVRVIDTFNVSGPTEAMPPGVMSFFVYIAFKSGEAIGKRTLKLTGHTPSGKKIQIGGDHEMEFHGQEQGAALIVEARVAVNEAGVYWIDVRINGRLTTRIPFRLRYHVVAKDGAPHQPKQK